jgi:hypothetical protein
MQLLLRLQQVTPPNHIHDGVHWSARKPARLLTVLNAGFAFEGILRLLFHVVGLLCSMLHASVAVLFAWVLVADDAQ